MLLAGDKKKLKYQEKRISGKTNVRNNECQEKRMSGKTNVRKNECQEKRMSGKTKRNMVRFS